jgi:glycosyltransferase involved in cell wall biosynthesis
VTSERNGVAIVIPASLTPASIIVVDDGSADATQSSAAGATHVLAHDRNLGKGAALRTGIRKALSIGAGAIVTIDADGQHDPRRIPALLDELDEADVVIGARRRRGSAMPPHRRFTNKASSAAVSHLTGLDIKDAQSGFRAFRRDVATRIEPAGNGYEYETEFLVLAARAGYRISSVEVPAIYGPESHFRLLKDGARVVQAIWSLRR